MFSFAASKLAKGRSILLDIQSGLVRGAFVEFHHGQPAKIDTVITRSIPSIPISDDSSRMTNDILKVVGDVFKMLTTDSRFGKADTIHYILSSPWIFSESKSIKVDYGKETRITQSLIDNLIKEQMSKNTFSDDTQHVEVKVCEIKLNGYVMEEFEGKSARILEVFLYNSFGSKAFFDKLTLLIQRIAYIKKHEYHSALLLQYSALRLLDHKNQDYIYIHVHSELTDVVVVKNGLCKHTSSFPFGTITLLRKISEATNQSVEASDSLLTLYQSDKLENTEKDNAKKVIDPLLIKWSDSCIQSLSEVFGTIYIPKTVFLSVHSHFEVFKTALLFNNDLNFDITSYDNISTGGRVVFEKDSAQSILMKLYTLVLSNMI